jgi:hypothetical protein
MITGNDLLTAVQNLPSMTEQKDKLDQPYLTYKQGVMDCWNYLYYELGMKDLADKMLDYVYEQQEEDDD